MQEKTVTYENLDINISSFSDLVSNLIIDNFQMETEITKLEDELYLINFFLSGASDDAKKNNSVALFSEDGKTFIRFKGDIDDISKFWTEIKSKVGPPAIIEPPKPEVEPAPEPEMKPIVEETPELTVDKIISEIKNKGYEISKDDAEVFISNFKERFNRMPSEKELNSIIDGYIKMVEEETEVKRKGVIENELSLTRDDFSVKTATTVIEEVVEEPAIDEEKEESNDLLNKLENMNFMNDSEKGQYVETFSDLNLGEKRKLIDDLQFIESQLEQISDLEALDKTELRANLVGLGKAEISDAIEKLIKSREPSDPIMKLLNEFKAISDAEQKKYQKILSNLDSQKQEQFIGRMREIETEFDELIKDGLAITDWERVDFRDELIRLTKEKRDKKMEELLGERKTEHIRSKIIEKIPQLAYEKTDKIIKELYWLSVSERDQRIDQIGKKFLAELEKKQELFEKSSTASACPDCGWPLGSFSKKCPRCGRKILDWM